MKQESVLEVKNLEFSFHTYGGVVKAVRDVSFDLREGEILGIVGESGCGKSVTAQCILKLNPEPPGFFGEHSSICFRGEELVSKTEKEMQAVRGAEIGFIFQDPMTSLNPTMKIGRQIEEVLKGRKGYSKKEVREKVLKILEMVGISDAKKRYKQYPYELSGGMKQRVMIAIALVGNPGIVIADDPTTSLDVTIEASILDLLKELQKTLHTAIIFITHDLGVIAKLCDRVMVMYGGKIVERGTVEEIYYDTKHPYTAGLMNSIARLDLEKSVKLKPIEGTPPDLFAPPEGCPFAARCEYAMNICYRKMPPEFGEKDKHRCMCWLQDEKAPKIRLKTQLSGKKGGEEHV